MAADDWGSEPAVPEAGHYFNHLVIVLGELLWGKGIFLLIPKT